MNPKRKSRLYLVVFLLVAVSSTAAVLMLAMEENINMFYSPEQIANEEAPIGRTIRAGGMVLEESVVRDTQSLGVSFTLTDYNGHEFVVSHTGILPDLFREGQGIIVQGQFDDQRNFQAAEVLAKHDENYMPPELIDIAEGHKPEANKSPVMQ